MRHSTCILLIGLLLMMTPVLVHAALAQNLQPAHAQQLVKQRPDFYLLDVRTPQEYFEARLYEAHLIPIDQLVRRLDEIPRNRPILVYCAVGSRSMQVVSYLSRSGFPEVYNLNGGIYAWAMQGYPYLRGAP